MRIVIILGTIIAMLLVKIVKLSHERDIYYNNYQQALMVLMEDDNELKSYLEKEEKDE